MDIQMAIDLCNNYIKDYDLGERICLDALENNNELRELVTEFGEHVEEIEKQTQIRNLTFITRILEHRLRVYKKELEGLEK